MPTKKYTTAEQVWKTTRTSLYSVGFPRSRGRGISEARPQSGVTCAMVGWKWGLWQSEKVLCFCSFPVVGAGVHYYSAVYLSIRTREPSVWSPSVSRCSTVPRAGRRSRSSHGLFLYFLGFYVKIAAMRWDGPACVLVRVHVPKARSHQSHRDFPSQAI